MSNEIVHRKPMSVTALWCVYPAPLRTVLMGWVLERPSRPSWPTSLADAQAQGAARSTLTAALRAFGEAIESFDDLPSQSVFVGMNSFKKSVLLIAAAIANRLEDDGVIEDAHAAENEWLGQLYASPAWRQWRRLRDQLRGHARYRRQAYREARRESQSTSGYKAQRRERAALENAQKRRRYWLRELARAHDEATRARAERRLVGIDRELDRLLHPRPSLQRELDREEALDGWLEDRDRIEDESDADDDRAAAE